MNRTSVKASDRLRYATSAKRIADNLVRFPSTNELASKPLKIHKILKLRSSVLKHAVATMYFTRVGPEF